MKVLRIPDKEKEKGMVWVLYPIIEDRGLEIIGYAELQIRQGRNRRCALSAAEYSTRCWTLRVWPRSSRKSTWYAVSEIRR